MKPVTLMRVIPIVEVASETVLDCAAPAIDRRIDVPLRDTRSRPLRDLRISVTDRCNFRCVYCMPKEVFGRDYPFLPRAELLTFEEIERVARVFVGLGVEKIRLTGGEPLLRKDIEYLVERLAALRTPGGGRVELTLTTNGSLLSRKAQSLRDAGLDRVTVSLDAIDESIFGEMNGVGFSAARVLEGIDTAIRVGLAPVKVNMVVKRGINDGQILPMARRFRGTGVTLRFIEFMDVGTTNGWDMQSVVPSSEVVAMVNAEFPLIPMGRDQPADTSTQYCYADGQGEIGLISSVTQPFCGACTRLRLSADGHLFTCLFASRGFDIRGPIRSRASNDELRQLAANLWMQRQDRYSEQRGGLSAAASATRVEMSFIGG